MQYMIIIRDDQGKIVKVVVRKLQNDELFEESQS